MIAWVSELTHGGHVFTYKDPILEEQAQQEKEHPVWAELQEATQGGRGCRRLHRVGGATGGYTGWEGLQKLSVLVCVHWKSEAWLIVSHCVVNCRQGSGGVWDSIERFYVNCGQRGRKEGTEEGQVNGVGMGVGVVVV